MGMFAVKNDKGEWLGWEVYQDDPEFIRGGGSVWTDLDEAKFYAKANGGHVVELAEAPAKIVVSEEEADMLEQAKDDYCAASVISAYSTEHIGAMGQDRLMRAYVIGWTVEKPKRYLIKVPHTDDSYFYKIDDEYCNAGDSYHLEGMTDNKWFTLAEIEHYELTDCEKVVCADSARTTGEVTDNE